MEINEDVAEGIKISTKDFECVIAVRKPNADTTITREFWFSGKAGDILKQLKGGNSKNGT